MDMLTTSITVDRILVKCNRPQSVVFRNKMKDSQAPPSGDHRSTCNPRYCGFFMVRIDARPVHPSDYNLVLNMLNYPSSGVCEDERPNVRPIYLLTYARPPLEPVELSEVHTLSDYCVDSARHACLYTGFRYGAATWTAELFPRPRVNPMRNGCAWREGASA